MGRPMRAPLVALALALCACAPRMSLEERITASCERAGFEEGTSEFEQCFEGRAALAIQIQAQRNAAYQQMMQTGAQMMSGH
jgi:hypothetical protein